MEISNAIYNHILNNKSDHINNEVLRLRDLNIFMQKLNMRKGRWLNNCRSKGGFKGGINVRG